MASTEYQRSLNNLVELIACLTSIFGSIYTIIMKVYTKLPCTAVKKSPYSELNILTYKTLQNLLL